MNRSILAVGTFALVLAACRSAETQDNPAGPTTVAIKGTVEDCFFDGTCVFAGALRAAAATASTSSKDGRVIVFAVDADANVYQASTLATGQFNVTVPAGRSYVVLFRDSAGQFLGTLIVNSEPASLTAGADLDLGTVSIDAAAKQVTSSNAAALAGAANTATVASPDDIAFGSATEQVSFSLYSPLVPGTVRVSQGTGSTLPGEFANDWRIARVTSAWAGDPLNREVVVEWIYRFDCWPPSDTCGPVLNDKIHRYLTADSFCSAGNERRDFPWVPVAGECVPDLATIGETYSFGPEGLENVLTILRAGDAVFPAIDGAASLPAFVMQVSEQGGTPRYAWFARGVGEALLLSEDVAPDAVDVDSKTRYRLVCNRAPDGTTVGTCPAWADQAFVDALPTAFPP